MLCVFVHPPSETLFDCCVDLVPAAERALRGRKSSADIPAWRRPSFWSHCGRYTELPAADEADPLQGLRDEIFTVTRGGKLNRRLGDDRRVGKCHSPARGGSDPRAGRDRLERVFPANAIVYACGWLMDVDAYDGFSRFFT